MKWRELAVDPLFNVECYLDIQQEKLEQKDKEIERLNNIINELEEYLKNIKMNLAYSASKWDNDCKIRVEVLQQVLYKLKELKESDANDK